METGIISAIRSRAWLVVGIIFFSLILFILSTALSDFQNLFTGRDTSVGEVAGQKINYEEYNARLQQQLEAYQRNTGVNPDEALRRQVSDQLWQQLVDEKFFSAELDAVGFEVTPEEVTRLFEGPDESPVIKQYKELYDPTTGQLIKDRIRQFMSMARDNEEAKAQYRQLKEQIVRNRLQTMYFSLVGVPFASPEEASRKFRDDRTALNFQYLAVNFAGIEDSTVEVSESDLRRYYDAHRARYKQDEDETEIKYVVFRKTPSAADSAAAVDEIARLKKGLEETTDDSTFVATQSLEAEPVDYRPLALLDARLQAIATTAKPGALIGPELIGDTYEVVKVSGFKKDSMATLKARHILVRPTGPTLADTLRARFKADSLARAATAANFAGLVAQHSDDPNTRFSGGELNWIARGSFGPDFDKAAARLGKGIAKTVVASAAGYHVLDVQDRDDRLVRLAVVRRQIYPSQATLGQIERQSIMLATSIEKAQDLDTAAVRFGTDVRTSPPLRATSRDLPGLEGSSAVVNWALRSEKGERSDRLETESAFVVAVVSEKIEKGFKPFDEVKDDLRPLVINELKAKKIIEKLRPLITTSGGDLEKLRQAYGAGAYVSRADNVFFGANAVPGAGNEPKLVGAVARLKAGTLSSPIEGRSGVFVVARAAGADSTAADPAAVESLRTGLATSRKSQLQSKAYQGLREAADIRDRRYLYGN